MVPTKRRTAGPEQARRRVLALYAGGHSLNRISRITGWGKPAITRLLRSQGIPVDESRIDQPRELEERMNEKKQPLALNFARQLAERQLDDAIIGGQVEKRALELSLERGGHAQEYLVEAQEEFEARYFGPVLEMEAQEQDSRQFEERPSAVYMSEEDDKQLDRRIRAYADKHGVGYDAALTGLLEEESN